MSKTKDKIVTTNMNGTGYEWEYAKKIDNRTTGQKCAEFIYHPETNAIFGRTPKSWGGLLLFYVIFYSVLAVLFAICMKLLLISLTEEFPKWQLEESIIGTNPGLGFRPMANDTEAASVIWFNSRTKRSWIDSMKKFHHENYKLAHNSSLSKNCKYNNGNTELQRGDFCVVDLEAFGDCSASYSYGFSIERSPCVFIKLNRIYGWIPEYYNISSKLPTDIPNHTKEKIIDIIDHKREINQVWLSCDGQSPHDKENQGEIKYWPDPGFPYYFYPYLNTKNYMSPLVAVQFIKPKTGVLINIECRAWAKNIVYKSNSQQREGSVHFEIMIDDE